MAYPVIDAGPIYLKNMCSLPPNPLIEVAAVNGEVCGCVLLSHHLYGGPKTAKYVSEVNGETHKCGHLSIYIGHFHRWVLFL